jgi:hypothetical protein
MKLIKNLKPTKGLGTQITNQKNKYKYSNMCN